jgi:hypothetical protein
MILDFSDEKNNDEKNIHICKICGETLLLNDFDETEGFGANGAIKKFRLSDELFTDDEETMSFKNIDLINFDDKDNGDNSFFKKILLDFGLHIEDINEAIDIKTFITKNLYQKAGVKLLNKDLLHIIIDSIQKIKKITPFSIYKLKEIRKLKEKGFSEDYIKKLEENGSFKEGYDRFFKIKRSSILAARYLISVQTSVPLLIRQSDSTICTFYSFDGDEGLDYISCIIESMNLVLIRNKTKLLEIMKESIRETYNEFISLPYIKELYFKRKEYDKTIQYRKDKLVYSNENELVENTKEYETYVDSGIIGMKKGESIEDFKKKVIHRIIFLANSLKYIISKVISTSQITDPYVKGGEGSCCSENADTYINYYYYIQTESNYPIFKNIEESNRLYKLSHSFIETGSIHKFIMKNEKHFNGIENTFIMDDVKTTSKEIIQ